MDYASIHGPGISTFSSSSPHRLPTVSAAQVLQDLKSSSTRCISSGLRDLDAVLQNRDPSMISEEEVFHGGVSKGKVTEIYGPSGVGKTALGMQLAASALHAGERVIWVDASHPVSGPRFSQIIRSFQPLNASTDPVPSSPSEQRNQIDPADNLTHFSTPTLAHLLALLTNQTPNHLEPRTSLVVIDSFSTLVSTAFPRTMDSTSTPRKPGVPNPSSRKFPILQFLISSLQKLAATRNISIVVFSQCVTKMRQGAGAVLVPAINFTAWEQGLGCRVALFRDWGWNDEHGHPVHDVRLAEVVKAEGVGVTNERGRLVGFSIGETGLCHLTLPVYPTLQQRSPLPQRLAQKQTQNQNLTEIPTLPPPKKRKIASTNFEIPDSDEEDDEDYGWAEEDEGDIPAMPPQWQGSEDILVPPPGELEAEEDGVEEDLENVEKEGTNVCLGGKEEIVDSEDELAL